MYTSPTPQQQQRGNSETPQQKEKKIPPTPRPPPIMTTGIKVYDEFFGTITEHIPASKFNTNPMKRGSINL